MTRWGRVAVLVVILLLLGGLKLLHAIPDDYYGPDGGTYFQIARHVYEGDGLVTSVSPQNQGLKQLPGRTTIYPLWPLTLGLTGRVLGLEQAARIVPKTLYLLDLLLLYALTNRLVRAWRGGDARLVGLPVDLGHVVVVLFGLNEIFFRYSSLPYTDPLALGMTFAALLALAPVDSRHAVLRGGLAGLLAGGAYLSRTPMIVVPAAILSILGLASIRSAAARRVLLAASAGCFVVVVPWFAFLASFVHDPHPMMLIDVFTRHRETPELQPVTWVVAPATFAELVGKVLLGLRVAFSPSGPSYVDGFGPVAYAVPLAIVALLLSHDLRLAFARSTDQMVIVATATCALGFAVLTQGSHSESDFSRLWAFNHRYGLPYIVSVVSALACLVGATGSSRAGAASARRVLHASGLLLVVGSLAMLVWRSPALVAPRGRGPTGTERQLAQWLDARSTPPVVIARRAARLAVISRAGFHWIGCGDDPEQTRILFRHAGAELLVVRRSDRRCRFMAGLEPELELVATFRGDGPPLELYRFVGARDRAERSQRSQVVTIARAKPQP